MKNIIFIIAIALIGFLVQSVAPWWIIVILGLLAGVFLDASYSKSFFIPFVAIFLLWGILTLMIDQANESILSGQIGSLFGGLPSVGMILIAAVLGGLVAGFGGMLGKSVRTLVD